MEFLSVGDNMTIYNKACGLILVASMMLVAGCGQKEPEVEKIVGIEYDNPNETESSEDVTENTEVTETTEKKGVTGNGLAGLEDLQKEFDIDDTEKTLSQSITDIPNYLANYIAQYYTKENMVLDTYKVINSDKMIITRSKDSSTLLLFSLSNYSDTSKAVVNISQLAEGKLYLYKDYLVSVKNKLVKGSIYIGEGTPLVREEDIGAKSVLKEGKKIKF